MPIDMDMDIAEYVAKPIVKPDKPLKNGKRGPKGSYPAMLPKQDAKNYTEEKNISWGHPVVQRLIGSLAAAGFTNAQISGMIGVSESGLCHQIKRHPQIEESLLKGRSEATCNVVAASYKRALGYTYKEDHVTKCGDIIQVRKHMPGNPQMQMFWLNNRDPENWQTIKNQMITENGIGNKLDEPEQDKITKLFGNLFTANPKLTVRECKFQDESAFASGQELGGTAAVRGDVQGMSADSVQDDVLDVPAQERAEREEAHTL